MMKLTSKINIQYSILDIRYSYFPPLRARPEYVSGENYCG